MGPIKVHVYTTYYVLANKNKGPLILYDFQVLKLQNKRPTVPDITGRLYEFNLEIRKYNL